MSKSIASLLDSATRLWMRMFDVLTAHNERAVAAWGSSLQYKRRYTNPDDAKRARQGI
jgi:hypothetical protein